MMNVQMSSDIRKFKPRLLFGLTKRELICAGISLVVGYSLYSLLGVFKNLEINTKIIAVTILVFPILCIGWVRPFDMPLEKFIIKYFIPLNTSPKKRIYKTDGIYDFPKAEKMLRNIPQKKLSKKQKKEKEEMLKKYNAKY